MTDKYDVIFEGRRVSIPKWTKYLVQEVDGSIRALQEKPVFASNFKVWSVLFGFSEEVHKGSTGNSYEPVCKEISCI